MRKVVTRGESIYFCDVCNRKTRITANKWGLDVLGRCIITSGCKGRLSKVTQSNDIINTPALTPAVVGVQDWFQRKMLYTHTQVVASNIWEVKHNLSTQPTVHVLSNNVTIVPQQIITVDSNTTQLLFGEAKSGIAQFVGTASQNTSNPIIVQTNTTVAVSNIQISNNNSLLTIATKDQSTNVIIGVRFLIDGQNPVDVAYTAIDNIADSTSAWGNTSQLMINNQLYAVRTINLITHANAISYFLSGQIPPTGARFFITHVNDIPVQSGDVLALLANSPYGTVDRIYDKILDLSGKTNVTATELYSFGKLYTTESSIKNVYPHIVVV